jgi:hypothetical protein
MVNVLKQCGDNLTRENVMKQAEHHGLGTGRLAARHHDQDKRDRFCSYRATPAPKAPGRHLASVWGNHQRRGGWLGRPSDLLAGDFPARDRQRHARDRGHARRFRRRHVGSLREVNTAARDAAPAIKKCAAAPTIASKRTATGRYRIKKAVTGR